MVRLTPELRLQIGKLARTNIPKKVLVESFCVSRTTIWYWGKQNLHYIKDLPRNHKFSITVETEISILYFRNTFGYGCARIQQRLFCAPSFELEQMEVYVQGVNLSRQSINRILRKHKLNGYKRKTQKSWKFFRAKYPDELWQLDLKGYFIVEGKKYWILVCIDDYSRFILKLHLFDHQPDIPEIEDSIKSLVKKYHPVSILTDNNPFKDSWEEWCRSEGIKALFAHPYYPQDKGKVERTIRNLTEEFIDSLSKFPQWLKGKMEVWREWFNNKRYHRGVEDYPANLYLSI